MCLTLRCGLSHPFRERRRFFASRYVLTTCQSRPNATERFSQVMFVVQSLIEPAAPIERCNYEEKEMRLLTRLLGAAVLTTACYLSVPAMNVLAQAPSPAPGPSKSAPDLSDQKLNAAAAAIERVASLQQNYRQRVAEAEAPADKERIVAEANNELTKAVTEQGLSVEEYVSILDVARDNPEIRSKILQRMRPSGQ